MSSIATVPSACTPFVLAALMPHPRRVTRDEICYFPGLPGAGSSDVVNRHIVIGALAALLFVAGTVLSLIRGETLMAVVLGLGGLAFIVRTVLAVRSSSRKKDD